MRVYVRTSESRTPRAPSAERSAAASSRSDSSYARCATGSRIPAAPSDGRGRRTITRVPAALGSRGERPSYGAASPRLRSPPSPPPPSSTQPSTAAAAAASATPATAMRRRDGEPGLAFPGAIGSSGTGS